MDHYKSTISNGFINDLKSDVTDHYQTIISHCVLTDLLATISNHNQASLVPSRHQTVELLSTIMNHE